MSQTISSSDLKRQLGGWLDWIGRTREDIVIQTYGRPVAVLLAYEEYADFLAFRQARAGEAPRRLTPPSAGARSGAGGLSALPTPPQPATYAASE